jgi:glutamate carboxypeptidase
MKRSVVMALVASLGAICRAELSSSEQRIAKAAEVDAPDSVALLEKLVNINSGTMNLAGVRRVGQVLRGEFEQLGFEVRWVAMDEVARAGHLVAERKGLAQPVLLIGHMDTVFEPVSPFQKMTTDGTKANGPGVADDKGGVVVMIHALKALASAGALDGSAITVVLTGDEERLGQPISISRRDMVEAAKRSGAALCFERAVRAGGREFVLIERNGVSYWSLKTTGAAGHGARIFGPEHGSGAIYEMARILNAFQEQLQEPGLTFNTALAGGGASATLDAEQGAGTFAGKNSIIPSVALASGDIRAKTQEQLERVKTRMRQIVARHLPRTGAEIEIQDFYPAMPATGQNRALLRQLNQVNRDLNAEAEGPFDASERGAGDISFVAPYVGSLSGMGAVGDNTHSPQENADLSRMALQIQRAALLIYRLTHQSK